MKRRFYADEVLHIYQRTVSGFNIFYSTEDFLVFYTIVSVKAKINKVCVMGLCFMIDHLHQLVSAESLSTSETLNKKMAQAYANGLTPIYCVGESLDERKAGNHFAVCKAQIEEVVYNLTEEQFASLVIAYEPVWAIGTGKTATAEQAQEIHA